MKKQLENYSIFKQEDDLGNVYYNVYWTTNYGTKNSEVHFKNFDSINEAKLFIRD
tara:strand:- start:706 stop:870 length:165 start_codon:yes stop_codon:yes gene_type:complete